MSLKSDGRWFRRMLPRSADESHRAATTLELFFDLTIVVAVAGAASGFHHQIAHGHVTEGLVQYVMVFFAIWWAWMNFTWFGSAYDCDDVGYRVGVFVQIFGAVIIAAGVVIASDTGSFLVVGVGYGIMRVGLIAGWIRAAVSDPEHRRGSLVYAIGVAICQVAWLLLVVSEVPWFGIGFIVLVIAELAIPIGAQAAAPTAWNRGHIAERYGLLTIIVLGETIVAVAGGLIHGISGDISFASLAVNVLPCMAFVFCVWWLYFDVDSERALSSVGRAFTWGYGHFFLFATTAAAGGAFAAILEYLASHDGHFPRELGLVLGVATSILFAILALLRASDSGASRLSAMVLVVAAVLALLSGWVPDNHVWVAVIAIGAVAMTALQDPKLADES